MAFDPLLTTDDILRLGQASRAVERACDCGIEHLHAWTRTPLDFPQERMRTVGTLMADPYGDPTYAEYHPHGTEYWSPDAPIALRHFPYNRCKVEACGVCGRACLAYVEAGGYYVEPRVRALDPRLVVDVPVDG